jgi:hypothetical protein
VDEEKTERQTEAKRGCFEIDSILLGLARRGNFLELLSSKEISNELLQKIIASRFIY